MSSHSPKSSGFMSGSGSVSQPDLSTPTRDEMYVSQRKRKLPNIDVDVTAELGLFRQEIMSFFKEFAISQKTDMGDLKQDLSEIKNELKTLKNVTQNLSEKYNNIHEELSTIKSENLEIKEKMQNLETEIQSLKENENNVNCPALSQAAAATFTGPPFATHEDLILEVQERQRRLQNLIIVGIPEKSESDATIRKQYDHDLIMRTLKSIYDNCPPPTKVMRLGKYKYGKNRPLKLFFESADTVKHIFKNRSKISNDVRIYADQTPAQLNYIKDLKVDLQKRQAGGELDLVIKYINGHPKIIKKAAKN